MAAKRRTAQTPSRDASSGRVLGSQSRLETDPKLAPKIVGHVSRGRTLRVAAQSEGVPHRTFFRWLDRGREDYEAGTDSVYARWADAMDRALGDFLGSLEESTAFPEPMAAEGGEGASGRVDPALATNRRWLLEKRLPEVYGKRVEHVVRVDAMEWLLAQLDAGVDAGRVSPGARAEVLTFLADVSPSDAADVAVH
jgi:hypothetical protein